MRLGILTDIHCSRQPRPTDQYHNPYAEDRDALLAAGLQHCRAAGVQAIVILGDLVDDGDPALVAQVVGRVAANQTPTWMVPGNHDCLQRGDALALAIQAAGAGHVRLADAAGVQLEEGIRLAGLGVVRHEGGQWAEAGDVPEPARWRSDLVLYLSHYPVISTAGRVLAAGLKYPGDLNNHEAVARPFLTRPAPTVILHGHLHVRDEVAAGPVLQLGCAALVEPPHDVTVLEITREPGSIHVRRQSAALRPAVVKLAPVLTPGETRWIWSQSGQLGWSRME